MGGEALSAAGGRGPAPRRALNTPCPARVRTDAAGTPVEVDGRAVEQVRESWLVEDRWWTERPLRRRYWEVLAAGGRNKVVFHDLGAATGDDAFGSRAQSPRASGGWFCQGA